MLLLLFLKYIFYNADFYYIQMCSILLIPSKYLILLYYDKYLHQNLKKIL